MPILLNQIATVLTYLFYLIVWIFIFLSFWSVPIFSIALIYMQIDKIRNDVRPDMIDMRIQYSEEPFQQSREQALIKAIETILHAYLPTRINLSLMFVFGMIPLIGKQCCLWTRRRGDGGDTNNVWASVYIAISWQILFGSSNVVSYWIVQDFHMYSDEAPNGLFSNLRPLIETMQEIVIAIVVYLVSVNFPKMCLYPILWWMYLISSALLYIFSEDALRAMYLPELLADQQPQFFKRLENFTHTHGVTFPLDKIYVSDENCTDTHVVTFPPDKIYVTDEKYTNVHLAGLLNPHIIIGCPLFMSEKGNEKSAGRSQNNTRLKFSHEETLAFVAHEFGHWDRNDNWKVILYNEFVMAVTFVVCGILYHTKFLNVVFQIPDDQPAIEKVICLSTFFGRPFVQTMGGIGRILMTRSNEYAADQFSKQFNQSESLYSGLTKIGEVFEVFPENNYLFDTMNNRHPCIAFRLRNL